MSVSASPPDYAFATAMLKEGRKQWLPGVVWFLPERATVGGKVKIVSDLRNGAVVGFLDPDHFGR